MQQALFVFWVSNNSQKNFAKKNVFPPSTCKNFLVINQPHWCVAYAQNAGGNKQTHTPNTHTHTLTTHTHSQNTHTYRHTQRHTHTHTGTLRCFECKAKHEKCHNCFCCNDGLTEEMCTESATSFPRKSLFHFFKTMNYLLWSELMLSGAYCDHYFITFN